MTAARLQLPARIVEGDVFKLRLLVQHPMDSGFLRDLDGVLIKRNVIRHLQCILHDKEVFRVEPTTGTAANPLFDLSAHGRTACRCAAASFAVGKIAIGNRIHGSGNSRFASR